MNITHDICNNHKIVDEYYEQIKKEQEEYDAELCKLINTIKGLYYLDEEVSKPYLHIKSNNENDKEIFAFQRIALFILNRERAVKLDQFNLGFTTRENIENSKIK